MTPKSGQGPFGAGPVTGSWKSPQGSSPTSGSPTSGSSGSPAPAGSAPASGGPSGPSRTHSFRPPESADVIAQGREPREPTDREAYRRRLIWLGGGGGAALVVGLIVILMLSNTGGLGGSGSGPVGPFAGAEKSKPPLAALCPPPESAPPARPAPPASGARVTDPDAGISYTQLGAPWLQWDKGTWGSGSLGVEYRVGYYFVTENYIGGEYLASVLSGAVPATVNDGLTVDLKCTGQQVAEDVRRSYYPEPNQKQTIKDELTYLGGRPAWVQVFRLSFKSEGLKATNELVAVALIDVGRPTAAVLYLSIPGTHRQYDPVLEQLLASVRPV